MDPPVCDAARRVLDAAESMGYPELWRLVERGPTYHDVSAVLGEKVPPGLVIAAADALARCSAGCASFTVNLYLAYTNVCVARCPICNFYARSPRDAYTMTPEDAARLVKRFSEEHGILEVHVTGGLNPSLRLDYYKSLARAVKSAAPRVKLKAFTAEEIAFISRLEGESVSRILEELREAGVDALPGGGAEVLTERVRRIVSPYKSSVEEYLRVHEEAHRLGIRSNVTMLYGHVEKPEDVAEHLRLVRNLQSRTKGFISFIPLRFNPRGTRLYEEMREEIEGKSSGLYDLLVIALSRLTLTGYIDNIVAYWVALGKKLAQAALSAGANDLGGTFYNEPVISSARGSTHRTTPAELASLASSAGWRPCIRDTLYNVVQVGWLACTRR